MRPGIVSKDEKGKLRWEPICSVIVSLFAEQNDLQYAVPGGLIGTFYTVINAIDAMQVGHQFASSPLALPSLWKSSLMQLDSRRPLTYTYLDCLLAVKMRGHKMAEIWEWLLMGSTADQYQVRPAGLLLCFVLVCRVMPRSLMFQEKLQLYKAKSSIFNSCFFILLYVCWKMEFNLFRFSTIIYLLTSYCKWFYWTKVD